MLLFTSQYKKKASSLIKRKKKRKGTIIICLIELIVNCTEFWVTLDNFQHSFSTFREANNFIVAAISPRTKIPIPLSSRRRFCLRIRACRPSACVDNTWRIVNDSAGSDMSRSMLQRLLLSRFAGGGGGRPAPIVHPRLWQGVFRPPNSSARYCRHGSGGAETRGESRTSSVTSHCGGGTGMTLNGRRIKRGSAPAVNCRFKRYVHVTPWFTRGLHFGRDEPRLMLRSTRHLISPDVWRPSPSVESTYRTEYRLTIRGLPVAPGNPPRPRLQSCDAPRESGKGWRRCAEYRRCSRNNFLPRSPSRARGWDLIRAW